MFLPSAPGCKGNVIRLRIAGDDGVFMVVIEGLRLRRVWELIMAHKTPWIHELPAELDFIADGRAGDLVHRVPSGGGRGRRRQRRPLTSAAASHQT